MKKFINHLPHSGDPFPTEHQMQAMYEAALQRERKLYGAASSTVEALMYELRTYGLAALTGPNCQRRLAELSTAQVRKVIERLDRLRTKYSAITGDLLLLLGKLI
jgi:hypothetical protein